jgi:hypothetical protein
VVVTPRSSVVEVQVILLFTTVSQTVVIPDNPLKVFWVFTQRTLEFQVAFLGVMLFTPAFEIGCASNLKLLVG